MARTLEERVAYLEGKAEEHSRVLGDIRDLLIHLDQKIDRFREELSHRIDNTNNRIDMLDQRLSSRLDALDQKVSKQFVWLVGIQITVLLGVIAALLAR